MLQSLGDKIFVKFKPKDELEYKSLKLIKSDVFYWKDGESDNSMKEKVNKILVNPQIATVMANNQKHKVAKGDVIFTHYLAYDWGQDETITINNEELNVIGGQFILFKIKEDGIELIDDLFLGKVIIKDKMTLSGLHINVESKREPSVVKITHVPKVRNRDVSNIKVGDTVQSINDYQYIITYKDEEYVVLKSHEIVGLIV